VSIGTDMRVTDIGYLLTGYSCRWKMVRKGRGSKRVPVERLERKIESALDTGDGVPLLLAFGSTHLLMRVTLREDFKLCVEVQPAYTLMGDMDGVLEVIGLLVYAAAMNIKRGVLDTYSGFDHALLRRLRDALPTPFCVEVNGSLAHIGVDAVARLASLVANHRKTAPSNRQCHGCPFRVVCNPLVALSSPSQMVRDCSQGYAWRWYSLLLRTGADPLHALTAALAERGERADFQQVAIYARASVCDPKTLVYDGRHFLCLHCGMRYHSVRTALDHLPGARIVTDRAPGTDVLLFGMEASELWMGRSTGGPVERFASRLGDAERALLLAALCDELHNGMAMHGSFSVITPLEIWGALRHSSVYREGFVRWGPRGPKATDALFDALRREAEAGGRWPR